MVNSKKKTGITCDMLVWILFVESGRIFAEKTKSICKMLNLLKNLKFCLWKTFKLA